MAKETIKLISATDGIGPPLVETKHHAENVESDLGEQKNQIYDGQSHDHFETPH